MRTRSPARVVVLEVPAPCEWLNSNDRLFHLRKAKLTAQWREAGAFAVSESAAYSFHGLVRVTAEIWKPRANRYDPGNLYPTAKAVLDGIVSSGLLVDDDWRHVVGPDMRHGGVGPARLVVTIAEVLSP